MARARFQTVPVRSLKGQLKVMGRSMRKFSETGDFLTDIFETLVRVVMRLDVLLSLVLAVVFIVTHMSDFNTGPLGSYLKDNNQPYAKFLKENSKKLFGLLLFLPTVLASSSKKRMSYLIASLLVLFMLKPLPLLHYSAMSLSVMVFTKAKLHFTKLVVLIAMCVFVYFDATTFTSAVDPNVASAANSAAAVKPVTSKPL